MSAGIRVFGDDDPTDAMEALAFQYKRQYIDIYSCSWGPEDTGWTMEGPEQLARDQLEEGTKVVSMWWITNSKNLFRGILEILKKSFQQDIMGTF